MMAMDMSLDRSKAKAQRDRHELCLIVVGQNSQIARFHEERRSIGDRDFHANSGVPRIVPVAGRPPLGCCGGGRSPPATGGARRGPGPPPLPPRRGVVPLTAPAAQKRNIYTSCEMR